ncbi:RusA family crossover junction endodeoxyribonuclease [Candidatus Pacearchaeota archaeon]|nr:RusA family crossover junction endodeoxyribonuclease [Candidatus Pacearchaeota archaeon]
MIYKITPVPKCRMTRSDKWKKREIVLRYFAFKNEIKTAGVKIKCPAKITFQIEMPKSWSKKKKLAHDGKPHLQTPDIDNLLKGLLDAVYKEDSHIWSVWAIKKWSYFPQIEIEEF